MLWVISKNAMTTLKTEPPISPFQEIELKLALLGADPAGLEKQLARMPALARRKASRLQLHNIYYDTPKKTLHKQRVALRVRRLGSSAKPEYVQTLKIGGSGHSALSQRGEWETPVPGAELDASALASTPWTQMDPGGDVFRALMPCFFTAFERVSWTVRKRDGSAVEVSLDIGQIVADGKSLPLCELELELLAGAPAALFGLARQIARTLAVMPEHRSKAERGYALADGSLNLPVRALPASISVKMSVAQAAQRVLGEMFCLFTANLQLLRHSDDAEAVHQARVGWRCFKSACRFFRPVLDAAAMPSWAPLQTLLTVLGELRDMDVARMETLPQFAQAYTAGDGGRQENWQAMTETLNQAAQRQRKAVRDALEVPAVGLALLETTQWLAQVPAEILASDAARAESGRSLRRWTRQRMARLRKQFRTALQHQAESPESQHRVRILAKRLRYGVEAFKPLLPERRSQRWHQQATALQTGIGMARDLAQAGELLSRLDMPGDLTAFLRGVAAGQASAG